MYKAIIIDDERLARNELKKLLLEFPQIEVLDEAANAEEGIEKIDSLNPDLIFLDIQMPGKTGFDMLQELDKAPHVIFTTAYDEYALKAFEVNALDYLMKPIEPKRLADALQNRFAIEKIRIIPNVVDTTIFYPAQNKNATKTRFIHISNMNFQKNTEAILEALHLLKTNETFEMYLFGTDNTRIKNLINDYALQDHVFIRGEVAQPELADAIRQSDALVLYSRFETFGCVIIEANACGIPVIVSDIEVFHELVEEGVNGMFAETENPKALAQKLKQFILQKNTFDKMAIADAAAQKYNFKKVGQQFLDLYKSIIN